MTRDRQLRDEGRGAGDQADSPGGWDGSWEAHRERQRQAWMDATPAQRLAWLEDALLLAHRAGALPRHSRR